MHRGAVQLQYADEWMSDSPQSGAVTVNRGVVEDVPLFASCCYTGGHY